MPRSEFAHWIAFYRNSPSGAEFDDAMNAMLCATIVASRFGASDAKLDPGPFFIHPENKRGTEASKNRGAKEPTEEEREQQAQQLTAYIAQLENAHGKS